MFSEAYPQILEVHPEALETRPEAWAKRSIVSKLCAALKISLKDFERLLRERKRPRLRAVFFFKFLVFNCCTAKCGERNRLVTNVL